MHCIRFMIHSAKQDVTWSWHCANTILLIKPAGNNVVSLYCTIICLAVQSLCLHETQNTHVECGKLILWHLLVPFSNQEFLTLILWDYGLVHGWTLNARYVARLYLYVASFLIFLCGKFLFDIYSHIYQIIFFSKTVQDNFV